MSTFTLKLLALVFMLLDHIGYYIEGMPVILRCIGRLSYPLFLFCMVWGYSYTRSRPKYLLRLYLMSLVMTCIMLFMNSRFALPDSFSGGYGNHNIFVPLLIVGVLISTIELYQRDRRKGALLLGAIAFLQVLYLLLPAVIPAARSLSGDILTGIIPSLAIHEYGISFVALGVLMYFLRENRAAFSAVYILFCIVQFSEEAMAGGVPVQWLMIFALPLMLGYNRKRGHSLKGFFYIFYPAHTLLLFFFANYILK